VKPIEDLLRNLARPEVLEFGLVTNRLPSVNIGGKFEPVDDEAPTTEKLLGMLVTMGGSPHVETLSEKPVQWTTRLDGVGVIAVAAIMRKDVVQARFTVARRDAAGRAASLPPLPPQASARPPAPAPADAKKDPLGQSGARSAFTTTQQGTGPSASQAHVRSPLAQSQVAPSPGVPGAGAGPAPKPPLPSQPMPAAASSPAAPPPAPASAPEELDDDDDEPTVQTLSPPVAGTPGGYVKPKPARKPEDVPRDTGPPGSGTPASPAGGPRTERVPPDAVELGVRRESTAPAPVAAAAPAAVAPPAIGQRPSKEKRPSDRAVEAPAPAVAPGVGMRRIHTPTSVDSVDVEITTRDGGKGGRQALVLDLEADRENTLEVTPAEVAQAHAHVQAQAQRPVTAAMPSAVPSTSPSAGGTEKERPRGDTGLESFLGMAVAARATDLHVIAGRPMLLRVATDLLPRTQAVPAEVVEGIAREIVPARLRETLDVDGSCDFAIEHPQHGRFRVNVGRLRGGYKLSMRCIPRETPTLASLGLPAAIAAATTHQQGLVLVTGPAGNGKTSTLAAIVDQLNTETSHHILTIEDPVEYVHGRKRALVSHREVGSSTRSYGAALRAAMREDPDVIVVGELRDAEAARLAVRASETGHLVLATIDTASAAKTIDRLIDLFPSAEQHEIRLAIAGSLRMIIGQRLVPSADRTKLFVATELLPSSIALYTLIRDGRTFQIPSLQQRGRGLGVVRLDESLADLVRAQKVTVEVAKQYAESPPDLEALVARGVPAASRKGA
jgi:twitching motility protein PilT